MSALIIGDIHFKISNALETSAMAEAFLFQIDKLKPKFVVILGDVLDRFELIHVHPLERSIDFIKKVAAKVETFMLIGNHDRPNNNVFLTTEHPFTALKGWPNLTVIDTTYQHDKYLFVPYVAPGRFNEAIKDFDLKNVEIVFAHQEFKNAKMGPFLSIIGDEWPATNPLCVSGHIHDHDWLQTNLLYTGTPIQHGYDDHHFKSVSLLNLETKAEIRVNLNLITKLRMTISLEEAKVFVPSKNVILRLSILATPLEFKTFVSSKKGKELASQNVTFKRIEPKKNKVERSAEIKVSFSSRLNTRIASQTKEIQNYFALITQN